MLSLFKEQPEGAEKNQPEFTWGAKTLIGAVVSIVILFATFVSGRLWTMQDDMAEQKAAMSQLQADMSKWSAIVDNREAIMKLKVETETTNRLFTILLGEKAIKVDKIALPRPSMAPDRIKAFREMYEQRARPPKSAK